MSNSLKTWLPVGKTAEELGISRQTLYRQINTAINFPHTSPFKRGTAWRKVSEKKIQININEWLRILQNL
jgi:predicted DNA-binding transcriptional regulator AlpA